MGKEGTEFRLITTRWRGWGEGGLLKRDKRGKGLGLTRDRGGFWAARIVIEGTVIWGALEGQGEIGIISGQGCICCQRLAVVC